MFVPLCVLLPSAVRLLTAVRPSEVVLGQLPVPGLWKLALSLCRLLLLQELPAA